MDFKILVGLAIIGLIIFGCGFYIGVQFTTKFFIKVGMALIDKEKINISIDEKMIENAIYQYKNNIGGCLFMDNYTIYG